MRPAPPSRAALRAAEHARDAEDLRLLLDVLGLLPERREPAPGFVRPTIRGVADHGRRGRYNAGCRCPRCTAANAAYARRHRAEVRWSVTSRGRILFVVIEVPTGRGHGRAWPGQVALAVTP